MPTLHSHEEQAVEAILDGGKSLGGALQSGTNASRKEKRSLARDAQRISNADRLAAREELKAARRQLQREAHAAAYLPKNGESGDASLTYASKVEG